MSPSALIINIHGTMYNVRILQKKTFNTVATHMPPAVAGGRGLKEGRREGENLNDAQGSFMVYNIRSGFRTQINLSTWRLAGK